MRQPTKTVNTHRACLYLATGANKCVIAGLVPAIQNHKRTSYSSACWIPGTSPGMTGRGENRAHFILETLQMRHGGGRKG